MKAIMEVDSTKVDEMSFKYHFEDYIVLTHNHKFNLQRPHKVIGRRYEECKYVRSPI